MSFFLMSINLKTSSFINWKLILKCMHRAVVYCDTLQFSAMVLAIVAVMILGTNHVGGIEKVFEIAEEGNRLIFFKWVKFNIWNRFGYEYEKSFENEKYSFVFLFLLLYVSFICYFLSLLAAWILTLLFGAHFGWFRLDLRRCGSRMLVKEKVKIKSTINIFSRDVRPFYFTGITPECVQRFVAIPKLKDAVKVSELEINFRKYYGKYTNTHHKSRHYLITMNRFHHNAS